MKYLIWAVMLALVFIPPMLIKKKHEKIKIMPRPPLTNEEIADALAILNLQLDATIDEIKEAHRRLIQKNHPDKGGSIIIASSVNRARDVLLRIHNHQQQRAA